ncbi:MULTISPECIES: sugar-phosphatase [unclassified Enterococcus]|jgi:Cof subfamily protein (haloacid dehalogenase superfamily)|uniref:sugar-phosphatase n=1 Tax=unclassified Enterococcus TaxID=2608891 RepID=UPI0006B9CFF8|nr:MULTISPECIES: sugar-phosphatase [unclassified Enterococcus]KPG71202.1 sugar phosphatase [Enterococcus sp. RIT-PI-f]HCE11245.1 Cof-type HAD-IIB family hydrolase [Enterococcus sp.]
MSIKLIAIDIDGTLLNDDRKITPAVYQALKAAEAQGVRIVLCTGRPLTGVQDLLTELDLFTDNDFVITYNGSLVQKTKDQAIISEFGLSHEDYAFVEMTARQLGVHLHVETQDTMFTANRDISPYTVYEAFLVNMPLKYRTPEEMTPDLNIIKMMMIDEPALLDSVIPQLPAALTEQYNVVKSAPFFLEVLNKKAHKGAAVKKLAEHLGIDQSEVMAIGDNENDLTMVEYAGIGVAMANATENVRNMADVITASNEEDGVAKVINEYVLQTKEG